MGFIYLIIISIIIGSGVYIENKDIENKCKKMGLNKKQCQKLTTKIYNELLKEKYCHCYRKD